MDVMEGRSARRNAPILKVSRDFDPGKPIRPRFPDSSVASGHGAASKGRTHDRKRPRPSDHAQKVLANQRPSTHETLPKFAGTSVMIGFVPVYALVAMALAQARAVREAAVLSQVLCHAALGMAWIVPVMPLISWMEKPDPGA